MREEGEWSFERGCEEEEEEENTHGDEDFVRDLHETKIIEDKNDRCECHQEEKSESQPFVYFSEEKEMCVHEEHPGEEEEYTSSELEEGIDGGYFFSTKSTLASEESVGENRKEIEESEGVSARRTVTPTCGDATFFTINTPNEHRCETPEDGSEDEERDVKKKIHEV